MSKDSHGYTNIRTFFPYPHAFKHDQASRKFENLVPSRTQNVHIVIAKQD